MLCSRTAMGFLSLKTDCPEGIVLAWTHLIEGTRKSQPGGKGTVPESAVAPGYCLFLCHAASLVHTQDAFIAPKPKGATPTS